jgi:senataxin
VSNWNVFCDSRVTSYLQSHVPPSPVPGWPENPLPPGLLVLLIADDAKLRIWAKDYASRSKLIPKDLLSKSYIEALELVVSALDISSRPFSEEDAILDQAMPSPLKHIQLAETSDLWSGIYTIMRLLPPEWLNSNLGNPLKLRRVTLSHLQDPAPRQLIFLFCSVAFMILK